MSLYASNPPDSAAIRTKRHRVWDLSLAKSKNQQGNSAHAFGMRPALKRFAGRIHTASHFRNEESKHEKPIRCSRTCWAVRGVGSAFAQNHVIKAGKKGDIIISEETKVGDTMLKPGHYEIQHRDSGSDHFVRFVAFRGHSTITSSNPATPVDAGDIKCSIEALPKKSDQTEVHTTTDGGMPKITRVIIRGETVAHVF